jgi:hypothetical protein
MKGTFHYTVATERCRLDGGDDVSQGFIVGDYLQAHLDSITEPKVFVLGEG